MKCDDIEPLLAPYVDDEAPPAERERVGEHLRRCPPCAARAATQRAARRLVQARAEAFSTPAPAALRARCAALARRPRRAFTWPFWTLATATASVAVLAIVLTYGMLTRSTVLFAAGLTLDHLKCFALAGSEPPPADMRAVEASLERRYGRRLAVPPGDRREHLTLLGVRRCLSTDGGVAHVLYRHGGIPLSLFVLPDRRRAAARLSFVGHVARIWSDGPMTYVLVGSESDAGIQPLARYFEAAVH